MLFNTYSIQKKEINVAELLLKTVPDYKRRISNRDAPLIVRLQAQNWDHFPKCIDPLKAYEVCTKYKKYSDRNSKKCKVTYS